MLSIEEDLRKRPHLPDKKSRLYKLEETPADAPERDAGRATAADRVRRFVARVRVGLLALKGIAEPLRVYEVA